MLDLPYWAVFAFQLAIKLLATKIYWALLGLAGGLTDYWALQGLTGPYWALLSLTEPYYSLLGLTVAFF